MQVAVVHFNSPTLCECIDKIKCLLLLLFLIFLSRIRSLLTREKRRVRLEDPFTGGQDGRPNRTLFVMLLEKLVQLRWNLCIISNASFLFIFMIDIPKKIELIINSENGCRTWLHDSQVLVCEYNQVVMLCLPVHHYHPALRAGVVAE